MLVGIAVTLFVEVVVLGVMWHLRGPISRLVMERAGRSLFGEDWPKMRAEFWNLFKA